MEEIRRICDPQVGVGADQLVVLEPSGPESLAFIRFYNVDGPEAEACGNATRCVAWLLLEETDSDRIVVETRAGLLEAERVGVQRVRCAMGPIRTDWRSIPLSKPAETLHLGIESGALKDPAALNIGNPHAVFFVDDLDAIDIEALAPAVQTHPLFPSQVNVGVAQLVAPDRLRLAVYERGVGLTAACGSGSCVAVFAARIRGLTQATQMTVQLEGGEVVVEITPDKTAYLTGPVEYCFYGTWPSPSRS